MWARLRWWRILAIALSLFVHLGAGMLLAHASLVHAPTPVAVAERDALIVEFLTLSDPKPVSKLPPVVQKVVPPQPAKPLPKPIEPMAQQEPLVAPKPATPEPPATVAVTDTPMPAPAPEPQMPELVSTPVASAPPATPEPVEAPLTASGKRAQSKYLRELMAWLAKHRVYPTEARKEKAEGIVQVRFSLDREGHLLAASVQRSAGFSVLDQAALDVLRRAAPMPAFPKGLDRQKMTVSLPIDFSLQTD
ncbi:energy transducer TonB [Ahniella affigens]|nr:energy transducer TonB [Ahniella affigens]